MNSRTKGKVGEREFAEWLRAHGFANARRGQQYCGADGSADVVGVPGFRWEVKRVQALNLDAAMTRAIADAGEDIPIVAHRKNNAPWLVTLRADDFERAARAWINALDAERLMNKVFEKGK